MPSRRSREARRPPLLSGRSIALPTWPADGALEPPSPAPARPRRDRPHAGGRALRSVAAARVPVAGPRGEHEQQPRVGGRADLVALLGLRTRTALPARRVTVSPASTSTSPSTTVRYARSWTSWSCERLPGGQVDRDRAAPRRASDCRICGWCGSTPSVVRSQCCMTGTILDGSREKDEIITAEVRAIAEVERARELYAQRAWSDAHAALSAADRQEPLGAARPRAPGHRGLHDRPPGGVLRAPRAGARRASRRG